MDNKIVWYLMTTFMGILIVAGGAWASSINNKVEKIAALEINIQYIQTDVSDIKNIITKALKEN